LIAGPPTSGGWSLAESGGKQTKRAPLRAVSKQNMKFDRLSSGRQARNHRLCGRLGLCRTCEDLMFQPLDADSPPRGSTTITSIDDLL